MKVSIFGNGPTALQYHEQGTKADVVVCCNYGQEGLKGEVYFIQDHETIIGWMRRKSEPNCKTVYMSKQAFAFYNNLIWRGMINIWEAKVELFDEYRWPFTSSGLHAFLNVRKYCPEVTEVDLYGMDCFVDAKVYRTLSSSTDEAVESSWMLSIWMENWKRAIAQNLGIKVRVYNGND
jgi:hypothetical protein